LSGATEPPLSLMRGLYETTGAEVIHVYGATETTPLVAINYGIKSTSTAGSAANSTGTASATRA